MKGAGIMTMLNYANLYAIIADCKENSYTLFNFNKSIRLTESF